MQLTHTKGEKEKLFGKRMYEQTFEQWIDPEIDRRVQLGLLKLPVQLYAAQVVFHMSEPEKIRLNEEVKAHVEARLNRQINPGEPVLFSDLNEIAGASLTSEDPDSAHITLIWADGTCHISFDFHYNGSKAQAMIVTPKQYLVSAGSALELGHLRVFVDNLHSAVELAAKAQLVAIPDPTNLNGTSHGYVQAQFNTFGGKSKNAPEAHVKLLNRLSQIRSKAKYGTDEVRIDRAEAKQMLTHAQEMVDNIGNSAELPVT